MQLRLPRDDTTTPVTPNGAASAHEASAAPQASRAVNWAPITCLRFRTNGAAGCCADRFLVKPLAGQSVCLPQVFNGVPDGSAVYSWNESFQQWLANTYQGGVTQHLRLPTRDGPSLTSTFR